MGEITTKEAAKVIKEFGDKYLEAVKSVNKANWTKKEQAKIQSVAKQILYGEKGVDLQNVTVTEAAALLGHARKTMHEWINDGLPKNENGNVSLRQALPWIVAHIRQQAVKEKDKLREREREAQVAMKETEKELKLIKLSTQKGEIIPREEHEKILKEVFYGLDQMVDDLVNNLLKIKDKSLPVRKSKANAIVEEWRKSFYPEGD